MRPLRLNGGCPLPVAPGHQNVDKAPVVLKRAEVTASPQAQRLLDGGLEVPVVSFHRAVLVGLTAIVAAGLHAVVTDKGIVALCNILALIKGQVAKGGRGCRCGALSERPWWLSPNRSPPCGRSQQPMCLPRLASG